MRRLRVSGEITDNNKTVETFNPIGLGTMELWYDWSRYVTRGTITDFSGSGRTGTSQIMEIVPGPNGKNMGVITRTNSLVSFSSVSTRTVIRALIPLNVCWVLSDSSNYNYHVGSSTLFDSGYANAAVRNGSWRINGVSINPVATNISSLLDSFKPLIVSGVNTSNVNSNRFGWDRTYNAGSMIMFEDLIWSTPLTTDQVKDVEQYLAKKWDVEAYVY